jgi:hypothetical protein
VTWKNKPRFTRWPYLDHSHATDADAAVPAIAPPMTLSDFTWNSRVPINSAVSMPSRLIISSVKPNTPRNAAVPVFSVEW